MRLSKKSKYCLLPKFTYSKINQLQGPNYGFRVFRQSHIKPILLMPEDYDRQG
jgi:hypothetical protein